LGPFKAFLRDAIGAPALEPAAEPPAKPKA
jgi:hypothetical protein